MQTRAVFKERGVASLCKINYEFRCNSAELDSERLESLEAPQRGDKHAEKQEATRIKVLIINQQNISSVLVRLRNLSELCLQI